MATAEEIYHHIYERNRHRWSETRYVLLYFARSQRAVDLINSLVVSGFLLRDGEYIRLSDKPFTHSLGRELDATGVITPPPPAEVRTLDAGVRLGVDGG